MIRSRFKIRHVFWFIATLCLFVTIVWVVTVVAIQKCATGFVRGDIILLFPCLIGAALLLVLKGFRYITVQKNAIKKNIFNDRRYAKTLTKLKHE